MRNGMRMRDVIATLAIYLVMGLIGIALIVLICMMAMSGNS